MGEPATGNPVVVVMGVAGSGKTTIGRLLAGRLGVPYTEGDAFHPPANVVTMAAGQALDDDDRLPWLAAIGDWISGRGRSGQGGVVSCSALRRRYRDLLRAAYPGVWFLHLSVDRDLVVGRVAGRDSHFMPASLVDSQFQVLEPLRPDEAGAVVDGSVAPDDIVHNAMARLSGHHGSVATTGR